MRCGVSYLQRCGKVHRKVMQIVSKSSFAPIIAFMVYLLVVQTANIIVSVTGADTSSGSPWFSIAMIYVSLWWFHSDRCFRGIQLPLDTGCLMAILLPIALPYYVIKTQGIKGVRTILLIIGMYLISSLLAQVIIWVYGTWKN